MYSKSGLKATETRLDLKKLGNIHWTIKNKQLGD